MRLRWTRALVVATIAGSLAVAPAAARTNGSQTPRSPASASTARLAALVLSDVNAARVRRGLRPLRISPALSRAAASHSRDMASRGYFAHTSLDGSAFSRRVERFYGATGYRSWAVGENLLWASPDIESSEAIRMWMGSPAHRANLLNERWREVGLVAVHVRSAGGFYGGREVTIVTADFGARNR